MQKTGSTKRLTRVLGACVLLVSLSLGFANGASGSEDETPAVPQTPAAPSEGAAAGQQDNGVVAKDLQASQSTPAAAGTPYGAAYPVTLETDFSRPYKAISSSANSDFSLLDDLERLIRGSYHDPNSTNPNSLRADRGSNKVYLSVSRMENSHRVGRELIKAAENGVEVYVIHGKASQSKESRALQKKLGTLKHGHFKICQKGKSLACLAGGSGAIMHSKILLVTSTFTQKKKPAIGAIWSGSANLGGPSGERTYNNGLTIYNDKKMWGQASNFFSDMWAERNIGTDYPRYVASRYGKGYGYAGAAANDGYSSDFAKYGMFYSNLSNVTIYPTPIAATPTNNRDPVLNLLNRIVPDDTCQIRLQENRFKYRRIAVAHKLAELANEGCTVDVVAFEDDLKVNRAAHCQLYIRVCQPILDVLKTANTVIPAAWAKPHDKTIMVEANMRRGVFNPEERLPSGEPWPDNGNEPVALHVVQAGSAALTGSNLVGSDEITTETTDEDVYNAYMKHWDAITRSHEYRAYPY